MVDQQHYDYGIVGVWMGCNYGSVATYYALNRVIESFGKTVLMVDKPLIAKKDAELENNHSRRFANEHYKISNQYKIDELKSLNDLCDGFIVGSDQIWNYGISRHTGTMYYLGFADDNKKKIAYAASFGHSIDFAPEDERVKISRLMSRFDGISVRESSGVTLSRECYGIHSVQVLDPVFLVDRTVWDELTEKSDKKEGEKYLVTYILDPTAEKRDAVLHVAKKLGNLKIVNVLDGLPWLFEKNRDLLNLPNCIENVQVEDWLYFIKNSEFVITDSCHGLSFALIFKRPFISFVNRRRGYSRFASLSRLFGFEDRLISDVKRVFEDDSLLDSVDYTKIEEILKIEKFKSFNWLKRVIDNRNNECENSFFEKNTIKLLRNGAPVYNPKYWIERLNDNGSNILYLNNSNDHNSKHFISFKFDKFLNKNYQYRLKGLLALKTDSSDFSIYLGNSDTGAFDQYEPITVSALRDVCEFEINFIALSDNINCVAFSSSQIVGEGSFLEIYNFFATSLSNGNSTEVLKDRNVEYITGGTSSKFYKFSPEFWTVIQLDGFELLKAKNDVSPRGKFAFALLPDTVNLKSVISIKFQMYLTSSAGKVNIHLANSNTGKFVIVDSIKPDNSNVWKDYSVNYIQSSDSYDSIMVGAAQISGEERIFGIKNIKIITSVDSTEVDSEFAGKISNSIHKVVLEKRCTGCSACSTSCPARAITMSENEEGFIYPKINFEKCIGCGRCLKKCASQNPIYRNNNKPDCFAVMADDDIRKISSSGGVFTVAANYVLDNAGYVCGAAYGDDFVVRHIIVDNKDDLSKLRGSKYMQSHIGNVFKDLKQLLNRNQLVLFTGMPCQVAGLYSFLNKDYDNLITIDLLCHGITSSKVFNKYHADVLNNKPLTRLEFKEKEPWGWHAGVNAYFTDGTKYSEPLERDLYFIAYLKSLAKNKVCGSCVFNRLPRQGDITIGDFWGITKCDPEMHDGKGTSVVLVNNLKANDFIDKIAPYFKKIKKEFLSDAIKGNRIIVGPYRLHKNRDLFFSNFNNLDFKSLTLGCYNSSLYDAQKSYLLNLVGEDELEYYCLAESVSTKVRGRKIALVGASEVFENILKDRFGLAVDFYITSERSLRDKNSLQIADLMNGVSNIYVVCITSRYDQEFFSTIESYGYHNFDDYISRVHKPIILNNFDLSVSTYSDLYGNTIEGAVGSISSITFRGCNSHIIISNNVTGLQNLNIDVTSNSYIKIGNGTRFNSRTKIAALGFNGLSSVIIGKRCRFTDSLIRLYNHPKKSSVDIGDDCSFESDLELHSNSGKKILIGNDCMISHGVDFWAGDGHSVFNVNTKTNINSDYDNLPTYKNQIVLKDHVWVGKEAFLMHGTEIGQGSIIGARSVVKGRFTNNCAVAGNPARCVKRDIAWSRNMLATDISTECGTPLNVSLSADLDNIVPLKNGE